MKLLPAAVVQFSFSPRDIRRFAGNLWGNSKVPVFNFRRQALNFCPQAEFIRFCFADVRGKARIIQMQQRRSGVNNLPFVHIQFGDDPTFQVLDLLQFG